MSKPGRRFESARRLAVQFAKAARRTGNVKASKRANDIANLALRLAQSEQKLFRQSLLMERNLQQLSRNMTQALGSNQGAFLGSVAPRLTGSGGRSGADGYTVGIVGRKSKKGTVRLASKSTHHESTGALTAAFQKLTSAFSQLSQLRAEVEKLKQKR